MKNLIFVIFILLSTISYGQLPKDFRVLYFEDADSSVLLLRKIARQQLNPPSLVEVDKECITQVRNDGGAVAIGGIIVDNSNSTKQTTVYFDNITEITVVHSRNWKIHYKSKITNQSEVIFLRDREMAEKAYASLICLIRVSGNKHYEKILSKQYWINSKI
jgi:hypothetical protein